MRKQQKIIKGLLLLALMIFGALSIMAAGCGGGGGGASVDTCPGQKACGNKCIPTNASCCSDGYSCSSPFTCNSNSECECPAGQQLCGNGCIPAGASCCPNGSYCANPAVCASDNSCTNDSSGIVGGVNRHMFANGCTGGIIYGYTGPNYTVCNMFLNSASALCSKVINNCQGI
jgi:hypothetical protein